MTTLDLFCGIGGWGRHDGLDIDQDVRATRTNAGLTTRLVDVSAVPQAVITSTFGGVEGVVASPPCPPFSAVGTGGGVKDIDTLVAVIDAFGRGLDSRRYTREICNDPRSILSVEPLRWTLLLRPQWTAWEQVIGALTIYQAAGRVLADHDYSVWVGILDANDYGVPQNRRRAILIASRTELAACPPPTERRVMSDVLTPPCAGAVLRMGRSRGTSRGCDQPAPTMMFGKSPNDVAWYSPAGEQLQSLSLPDALVLQTFPADYPVAGGKVSRYHQVGDAIPRALADAILCS